MTDVFALFDIFFGKSATYLYKNEGGGSTAVYKTYKKTDFLFRKTSLRQDNKEAGTGNVFCQQWKIIFFKVSYIRIFGFQCHLAAALMFNYILHHLFWIQHLISFFAFAHDTFDKSKTTMHSSVCRLKLSFDCMPQQHRVSVPVKWCKWHRKRITDSS